MKTFGLDFIHDQVKKNSGLNLIKAIPKYNGFYQNLKTCTNACYLYKFKNLFIIFLNLFFTSK